MVNSLVLRLSVLLVLAVFVKGQTWKPRITAAYPRVQTQKNRNITLTCEGSNAFKPFAMTLWHHKGVELQWKNTTKHAFTEIFHDKGTMRTVNTSLTIRNVSAKDKGVYKCFLVTHHGSHHARILLYT